MLLSCEQSFSGFDELLYLLLRAWEWFRVTIDGFARKSMRLVFSVVRLLLCWSAARITCKMEGLKFTVLLLLEQYSWAVFWMSWIYYLLSFLVSFIFSIIEDISLISFLNVKVHLLAFACNTWICIHLRKVMFSTWRVLIAWWWLMSFLINQTVLLFSLCISAFH